MIPLDNNNGKVMIPLDNNNDKIMIPLKNNDSSWRSAHLNRRALTCPIRKLLNL